MNAKPGRLSGLAALTVAILAFAGCTSPASVAQEDLAVPHDIVAPEITEWMGDPAILVFSKTAGWRHNEGIAGADLFFVELARERGYGIYTSVNGAVFNPETLARFEVVVFNNMTGDTLSPDQETAFQDWLEAGGAWIGLHGAGDFSHEDWDWYADKLIGPLFVGHPGTPHFNTVRLETLAPDHAVMSGIPQVWEHDEEWYFFDGTPQDYGLVPLAGIYEEDFAPQGDDVARLEAWAMGDAPIDHPVIWAGCPGEGRSVYSALGHSDLAYQHPVNRQILNNAFDWVSGKTDADGAGCP